MPYNNLRARFLGKGRKSDKVRNGSDYDAEFVDNNAAVLSNYGIQITEDGHLVTTSAYDGSGFRFAPCLRFEYDYGFAESPTSGNYTLVNFGPRYLPFIVCNI